MNPLDLSDGAPWKARFRATGVRWSQLAPQNPSRGLVCTNRDGIYQLYTWDVPSGQLTRLTDKPAGMVAGSIAPDGRYVYYHDDEGGNEIGHYVRVPFEGGQPEDITPDMPPYASHFLSHSRAANTVGFTAASKASFQIYVRHGDAPPKLIHTADKLVFGPDLSYDGEIAVIESTERSGTMDTALVAFDTATGEKTAELYYPEASAHRYGRFSPLPGDMRLLATSSAPGYERPLIWDARTGETHDLPLDDIPGDLRPWDWSPDAESVLLCQLHQAEYQLYRYHIGSRTVTKLNAPPGALGSDPPGYFTPEGEIFTVWQDAAHPPELIALDGITGEKTRTLIQAGEAPAGHKWRSVSFTGANGEMIQAWLAVPEGEGPFPTVLHTHGGPTGVTTEAFSPASQAWLDHGFAWLSINYHGSITFGREFEKSIWGNLGDLEVQDMAAAYHWLVDNDIAQPDAVLVTGGSYGGYLTLQALGKEPSLWAGGMASIAIADWKLMYEDEADTLRGYQRALFGGAPDEVPEATRKSSPITYAENINAPILVIQGSNDTRCPARQMRAYEERLKALNKHIYIHWFDAGHGSRAMEQQIEHLELMLRFAYRVLG